MTELNLSLTPDASSKTPIENKAPGRGTGRIILVVVLSLFIPGLGQVYARKPLRGLLTAILITAFSLFTAGFHLLLTFRGFTVSLAARILLTLFITVDAGYLASAKRWANPTESRPSKLLTISATLLVLLVVVYPVPDLILRQAITDFGAFKVSSASMCPTICEGDRIVADRNAYASSTPHRGDLIMMKHPSSEALFLKRVVGIEGDLVTQDGGKVFVNGQPLAAPNYGPGCGPRGTQPSNFEPILFDPVKVPPSSLFVVGDNLPNSFDSRTPAFGSLTLRQVRGRPLFIYWSWTRSRIGCELH